MNTQLGNQIRLKRLSLNIKQSEIAKKLGLSESAYSKIERGETNITIERLREISEFLKTPLISFIQDLNLPENKLHMGTLTKNIPLHLHNEESGIDKLPELIDKQNKLIEAILNYISNSH